MNFIPKPNKFIFPVSSAMPTTASASSAPMCFFKTTQKVWPPTKRGISTSLWNCQPRFAFRA